MDAQISSFLWEEKNNVFLVLSACLITCLSFALGFLCQSGKKQTWQVHVTSEIVKCDETNQNKRTNQISISRTGEAKPFLDTTHKRIFVGEERLETSSSENDPRSFRLGKKWILLAVVCVLLVVIILALIIRSPDAVQNSSYQPVQIEIDEAPENDEVPEIDEAPESLPELPQPKIERKIYSGNWRWSMKPIRFDGSTSIYCWNNTFRHCFHVELKCLLNFSL